MTPRDRILSSPSLKTLLGLSLPNLAASLVQSLMLVAEGWYAGGLGPEALASIALVFPVFMFTMMLSAGAIGGAVSGAMARAVGAGDVERANGVLRAAVLLSLGIGGLKAVLVLTAGPVLFSAMGGEGPVLDGALSYAWALFPFIWVVWLTNMITGALRGTGDMIRPAVCTVIIVATHLTIVVLLRALDADAGLAGAGFAILGAYLAGLCYIVVVWSAAGRDVRLTLTGWHRLAAVWPVLSAGLLAGSQTAMTIAYSVIATAVFGHISAVWLAGYGIGVRLEMLVVPLIFGTGGAGIAMTGTLLGAGRRRDAIRIGWLCAGLSAALVGSIGVAAALAPWMWSGLYTDDPEIASAAAAYLRLVGPFYGFFALGLSLYFVSQGLATLLYPVIGAALRLAVVVLGLGLLIWIDALTPIRALIIVAAAMLLYGIFVAIMLRLGPWRPRIATAGPDAV